MTTKVNVHLKLGGAMVKYAPDGAPGSKHSLTLAENQTVQQVLQLLQVPAEQPFMIILNDAMVGRTEYTTTLLLDGDQLSLMPPIQAG